MSSNSAPLVGVVGVGIRGSMFARAIQQNPDATLVAICEKSSDARTLASNSLGVPGYPTVEAMLHQHPEINAAVIATPDFAHREAAVDCADRGIDLLIEKPLATSTADAQAIAEAVDSTGALAVVGFENRWNERFLQTHRELRSAGPGNVVQQIINLNDTLFVPTAMLGWAERSSPAWFLMPHSLDLALWLADAAPVEVFARGVRKVLDARGIPTWDAISASFALSDGSMVTLNSSWILPTSAPAVFDFRHEIQTHDAAYFIDIAPSGVTRYDSAGVSWPQFGVHERSGHLRGAPIDMIDDFIDVLNGKDGPPLPDAHHGLLITRCLEALDQSLSTGQPQRIVADLPPTKTPEVGQQATSEVLPR